MEIMQNSPPPTSSGKVKFHANAILLLFNYQLAPERWSSPDRFPFVGLHKAREAGLGGLHRLGENCSLASTCYSCCHMGLSWESHWMGLPGWADQGTLLGQPGMLQHLQDAAGSETPQKGQDDERPAASPSAWHRFSPARG